MNPVLGTPPRGTHASGAAFFASPSSPVPRRPRGTPSSVTSSNLRGASSPLSHHHGLPHRPLPSQPSTDRYVAGPSRQDTSMAHFLLTSTESKTPMLIRAAQQRQLSFRSPSRDSSILNASFEDAYPSPTRYAVDHNSPVGGAASPQPHGRLSHAGSTRLSSVFEKMHLDPSVRSSRDRSISNASLTGEAAVLGRLGGGGGGGGSSTDDDASAPQAFSFASSTMDLEPYTTKLARTLFSDIPQTTVLSVNDPSMRSTAVSPLPASAITPVKNTATAPTAAAVVTSASPIPATPLSPKISAATSIHFMSRKREEMDNDDGDTDDELHKDCYANEESSENGRRRGPNVLHEEEDEEEQDGNAENTRGHRGDTLGRGAGGLFAAGRVPLADSDVNLHSVSEGERYDASLGVVFECNRTRNFTSPSFRVIPHTPERILDAADIEDDFYMNLLDWSAASDVLCVALQTCVYLWDAKTCDITELPRVAASAFADAPSTTANAQLVCGLNWAPDGYHLAVGRNSGAVEVWDVETQQIVHAYRQHTDRTVSLSWEPRGGSLLASGSRDSTIVLRDVRERDVSSLDASSLASAASVLQGHETEVCGLKWSPTGALLASGGNDNQLLLWDSRSLATGRGSSQSDMSGSGHSNHGASWPYLLSNSPQPLFYLNKHTAAVKALSWNPAQPALLVSGGGSHDRSLRFWNTLTGECVRHVNTGSQVCGAVWNRTGTELVTAHGYTDNQLSIWRYPSLRRVANLTGHTSRVLHLALSADGERVVSAAGDETLRFWRCFPQSELRESSPHLYRSFYSPSNPSSLGGSPYGGGGGGGGRNLGLSGSGTRARTAAMAADRCGSTPENGERLPFMNEEVELR